MKTPFASITASIQDQNYLQAWNDDLPVKVSHYIWGHDLEGGQSDMRASIDLSLNFAPHEISEGLQSVELGGHISFNQWTIRLAFS
jgi:hypothetical protein